MNVLGIFAKYPAPGCVKTRLAADIGNERAAELYAAFVADLTTRFRTFADRRLLCYSPSENAAQNYFQQLAEDDYELWPQPNCSLGARMESFFEQSFAAGARKVIVIGSDSPTLPLDILERAAQLLDEHDCVLGPASDGGYYLVGQRERSLPIFTGIDWGTSRVLSQTADALATCDARLALLSPWYDIDTVADLDLLRGHLQALKQSKTPMTLPNTEPLLEA